MAQARHRIRAGHNGGRDGLLIWGRQRAGHIGFQCVSRKTDFTNGMAKVAINWTRRSQAASVPLTPNSAIRGGIPLGILSFRK